MSLMNPWALMIGGLALGAPVVIHFLTKPRPRPMPLSTIRFVRESLQEQKTRHRLRDWLVLLLRLLAIMLISFAIARPHWNGDRIDPANDDTKVARVILLDVSQSMGAGRGGSQPLERSRALADRYLQKRPGLGVGVILAAARPEPVFEQLAVNFPAMRQAIRSEEVRSQACNAFAAVDLANQMLAETSSSTRRELIVISDFQRSDWGAVSFDGLPRGTKVQLESVALESSRNISVVGIRTPDRVVAGESFQCEVELANFTNTRQSLRCTLQIGEITKSVEPDLRPGQSSVAIPITIQRPGWLSGSVRIRGTNDDLPDDDERPWVLHVQPHPKVLLWNDQPADQLASGGYYLQRALLELANGDVERVARKRADAISESELQQADVVVIDHPGRMTAAQIKMLARTIRRGAGVLYFAAELSDGLNLRLLEKTLGTSMEFPVRYVAPPRPRRQLKLYQAQRREPPFAIFGEQLNLAFSDIRLGGGLGTRLQDPSLSDRVLAKLDDQSAFVAIADAGDGKIAVVNADLQQSNLPVKRPFLPLLGELTNQLLRHDGAGRESSCGKPLVRLLPADVRLEDNLVVAPANDSPADEQGYGVWEASSSGVLWQWPSPNHVGAYEVSLNDSIVQAAAITLPANESDLSCLNSDSFSTETMSGSTVGFRNARESQEDEDVWWSWLMVACAVGLMLETTVLWLFRT